MTPIEPDPLPDDLRGLLPAERARPPIDDALRARMLGRLTATAAVGAAAGTAAAASAAKGLSTKTWLVAITAFAFGSAVGAGATALLRAPEPPRIVERRVEVPVPVAAAPTQTPPAVDVPEELEELAVVPGVGPSVTAPSVKAAKPVVSSSAAAGSDAAELLAIDTMRSALARGDTGAALAAVADHEKRFPSGAFVQERETIAIQALARAGRTAEAKARAERFEKRHPHSPYLALIRKALP